MNYDVVLNANDNTALETQYAFTQGDYGQIQFSIRVKVDGQYITDALRAYMVFTLPNGMIVTGADMPKSVATYTYVFQGNELHAPGKVVADVKLVCSNGQISSNKFTFLCRFDPLADKTVPAGSYITALQKIIDDGQEKIDYLQELIDALQGGVGETDLTRSDLHNSRDPIDAGIKTIDANMAQYLMLKGDLINNGTTTTPGSALDARYGKTLKDLIDTANSNLVPSTTVITPGGLSFGTATGYIYKIHKFGKIGILDINIVGTNVIKDADYTIGTLGGYFISFDAPLIAHVYDKPKQSGYHLRCDNGILHIFCGQDDAAVAVSGMIPFLIP